MPEPGAPSDNTTLVEILEALRTDGYDGDFDVRDGAVLRCRQCGAELPAATVGAERIRRLEGASDPADMAAVLALRCTECGTRGTAVVRFGPEADEADAAVLSALDDAR
jgi:hypothetical protein